MVCGSQVNGEECAVIDRDTLVAERSHCKLGKRLNNFAVYYYLIVILQPNAPLTFAALNDLQSQHRSVDRYSIAMPTSGTRDVSSGRGVVIDRSMIYVKVSDLEMPKYYQIIRFDMKPINSEKLDDGKGLIPGLNIEHVMKDKYIYCYYLSGKTLFALCSRQILSVNKYSLRKKHIYLPGFHNLRLLMIQGSTKQMLAVTKTSALLIKLLKKSAAVLYTIKLETTDRPPQCILNARIRGVFFYIVSFDHPCELHILVAIHDKLTMAKKLSIAGSHMSSINCMFYDDIHNRLICCKDYKESFAIKFYM